MMLSLSQPDALLGIADPYPAQVEVFTDAGSAMHVAAGVAVAFLPVPWNLAALAAFLAYELSKADAGEPWARTGGKFAELAIGIVAGKVAL